MELARDTVANAVRSDEPPARSKLDPFREWIREQLRADPRIPAERQRELAVELGCRGRQDDLR
jgi:hypothetical protein